MRDSTLGASTAPSSLKVATFQVMRGSSMELGAPRCADRIQVLPDIDHDEAIPIREVFGILAALVPGMALPWLTRNYFDTETAICFFAAAYCGIRFVVAPIFKRFTVHRGIFHSIPFILLAGEAVALGLVGLGPRERVIIGASVVLGALTHLVLDEVFAVNFLGMKMKKSFGTAIKLWAPSLPATLVCYAALVVLSWQLWSRVGHKLPWF